MDTVDSEILDCYLVMTGPKSSMSSSSGTTRPWCIDSVYLFAAEILAADRAKTGRKAAIASSVKLSQWSDAEIYPAASETLPLTSGQREMLALFGSRAI